MSYPVVCPRMPTFHCSINRRKISGRMLTKNSNIYKYAAIFLVILFGTTFYTISRRGLQSTKKEFSDLRKLVEYTSSGNRFNYHIWPEFSPELIKFEDFSNCYKGKLNIASLHEIIHQWANAESDACRRMYKSITKIYTVSKRSGTLKLPDEFKARVLSWLGGNQELMDNVYDQSVTSVFNEYTQEETLYNPLRGKRPMSVKEKPDRLYVEELYLKSKDKCDFCNYEKYSAFDSFGRLSNKRAFMAANTFKVDAYHGLALLRGHHPRNWTFEDFNDLNILMRDWFNRVHQHNSTLQFACLFWDMLPHAGASQIHPHVHLTVVPNRYYGPAERVRRAAERFYLDTGANYFFEILNIHQALGLGVSYRSAHAVAYLTGKKDTAVLLMGKSFNQDFIKLFYCVIRTYLDDMDLVDFSLGGYLPQMTEDTRYGSMPVYINIVSRGDASLIRSDVSSLELFAVRNVNLDPWQMKARLESSVSKRLPHL